MTVAVSERAPSARRRRPRSLETLLFGAPGIDRRASNGRVAGALYVAAGLVVVATAWLLGDHVPRAGLAALGGIAVFAGILMPYIPWPRLHPRALLGPVLLSFVLLGVAAAIMPDGRNPYAVMYVVAFAYVGVSQPAGTSLIMLPAALASLLVPAALREATAPVMVEIAVEAPVWVVVAEFLAQLSQRLRRAEAETSRLLDASIALAHVSTDDGVADVTAALTIELLDSQSAVVFLADPVTGVFVNQGQRNFPIPLGRATLDQEAQPWTYEKSVAGTRVALVPDIAASPILPPLLERAMPAVSLVLIPLHAADVPIGVVVAGWTEPKPSLDEFARGAAELLQSEATRAFERLRAGASFDELTRLIDRRAYGKALDAIREGDVALFLDLDDLNSVNERFGRAGGDETLQAFAECLRQIARKSDAVARYGDDLFAMILVEAKEDGALTALVRLHQAWKEQDPPTTFSAGIAVHTSDDVPATTLARADAALAAAKKDGPGTTRVALPPDPIS